MNTPERTKIEITTLKRLLIRDVMNEFCSFLSTERASYLTEIMTINVKQWGKLP